MLFRSYLETRKTARQGGGKERKVKTKRLQNQVIWMHTGGSIYGSWRRRRLDIQNI